MVKVYTKTGDKGDTSLVGGTRVGKDHKKIELYGEVDELNSIIGLITSGVDGDIKEELFKIQHLLFNLGSVLACEPKKRLEFKLPTVTDKNIIFLENSIDQMQSQLSPLKNFILPGGDMAASHAHLARTVCRRVERKMVAFFNENSSEEVPHSLEFLNRLSDYFFVLARYINHGQGVVDIPWDRLSFLD